MNYDAVAASYAAHFSDELDRKPFDRVMLSWLAERVAAQAFPGSAPICDLGCGPGHVAAHLTSLGAPVRRGVPSALGAPVGE